MNRTSSQQVNHTANRRRANEANGSANRSLLLISLVLLTTCYGCSKTKAVNITSDSTMNVGQQMSRFYASERRILYSWHQ